MAKTSLSSARRGRAKVSRDYTAKLRTDAYVREAGRTAKMSTIGMVGSFAAGAAELGSAIGTKLKKWEQLEAGARQLHKEGGEGDFNFAQALGGEYAEKGKVSAWDKLTSQAPVTQQLSIGDDKFYGVNVAQVGALGESAGLLVDKDSDKSLYDYLKICGDKGAKTDVASSLETMKQARPESNKGTMVIPFGEDKGKKIGIGSPEFKKWASSQDHKDWLKSRSSGPKPFELTDPQNIADLKSHIAGETGTARFPKPDIVKPLTEKFTLPTIAKTDFSAYPEIESDPSPYISNQDLFQKAPVTQYRSSSPFLQEGDDLDLYRTNLRGSAIGSNWWE